MPGICALRGAGCDKLIPHAHAHGCPAEFCVNFDTLLRGVVIAAPSPWFYCIAILMCLALARSITNSISLSQMHSGGPMNEFDALPHGGLIRKMWAVEASRYREHLLRLDEASRRNRFGGAVSDEFLVNYGDLALGIDTVIHGFFVNGTMRGAGELRPIGPPMTRE